MYSLTCSGDAVDQQLEQLVLAGDVRVQRRRPGAELVRQPPHVEPAEPVGVDDRESGVRDPLARQRRALLAQRRPGGRRQIRG
jgi:hypothetical protein